MFHNILKRFANSFAYRMLRFLLMRNLLDENAIKGLFSKFGFSILRKSYYLPIPEEQDLKYHTVSELVGIDTNDAYSLKLIDNVFNVYKPEFEKFPLQQSENPKQFFLINSSFMAIDGNVYYSLIRHLKPARLVEIGSGKSTLLASAAITENVRETDLSTELICIEPYPDPVLTSGIAHLKELRQLKVQEVELNFFESLQANDILFIDSTHALRSGGDVWYEYCEILPRLQSGVYIHIHDISLPKPYPKVYFDSGVFWNEQYLLQAFLTHNAKFEIIWAGNYMITKYPDKVKQSFSPEYDEMRKVYPSSEPSSLWMRVK